METSIQKSKTILMDMFALYLSTIITISTIAAAAANVSWVNGSSVLPQFEDSSRLPLLLQQSRNHVLAPSPHNLVGCWIPKVGSRFIVRAMSLLTADCQQHPLLDCKPSHCPKSVPNEMRNTCHGVSIRSAYTNSSYLRFVVLRDPITRFLSGFLDKYSEEARGKQYNNFNAVDIFGGQEMTWREYLQLTKQNPTIDVLIDAIEMSSNINGHIVMRNHHITPQSQQCHLKDIRYDMYIDHSRLLDSFEAIDRIAGRSTGLFHLLSKELKKTPTFGAPHSTNASSKICDYITPTIATKLLKLYEVDYEMMKMLNLKVLHPNDIQMLCNNDNS